jgi:subtilisin family serine protease
MRTTGLLKAGRVALVAVSVVALAGVSMSAAAAAVDPIGPAPASEQTWIVTLSGNVDAAREAPELAQRVGGQLVATYSHALNGFAFSGSAHAAAALASNPRVAHVEASRTLHAVEIAPWGILRTSAWAAHQAGYTGVTSSGTPVRVAVVDTGIKLDHVDLAANIAPGLGTNCINPGQPASDDHGHGTHVAGTVAAAFNGQDVVGMATNALLIPVKVLNSTGYGTDAQVICGLDYVAGLARSQPGPYVLNLSLGDPNRPGETTCGSSALHQAICGLANAGVTVVAAAGNDGADAASFVPAAYDEVIAVSAFTDFDGIRSSAGCQADFTDYGYQCDDTLADFSNYGSVVDVTAPGVHVISDWNNGGMNTISGTSMAAPHVAGAAALVLGANPTLTPAQVRAVLETTGECPDGAEANAPTCVGHGQWQVGGLFGTTTDNDGIPEPLVNALRAAQAAGDAQPPPPPPPGDTDPPTVSLTSPSAGTVSGTVTLAADAADAGSGVASVAFAVDGTTVGTDTTAPYAFNWNTTAVGNGSHTITARATDGAGNQATSAPVAIDVQNVAPVATMHITRLTGFGQTGPRSWKTWAEIEIADQADQPVSGATVTFAVTGGATTTRSCTTGSTGRCSTSKQKVTLPNSASNVTYVTSNVAKTGVTWDGAQWGVTLVRPIAKATTVEQNGARASS